MAAPEKQETPTRCRPWLPRGETLIASTGIWAAVVVMAALAAAGGWTVLAQRDASQASQRARIDSLGKVLASTLESMLASDELSAARRLVIETRRSNELAACRILLPDGQVLADAEPAHITARTMPAAWSHAPLDAAADAPRPGMIAAKYPLLVPGRGAAMLQIMARVKRDSGAPSDALLGVGLISAAALGGLWLVYRNARNRLAPLAMIREALLAMQGGEKVKEAIMLAPTGGPEAIAWNQLVEEANKIEQQKVADHAREVLNPRRENRSDLSHACDSLTQGMIILDEQGRVKYANGAAAVFLQAKREALVAADAAKLIPHDEVKEAILGLVSGKTRQRKTIEVQRRDERGSGVFRFSIRPLRREDGNGFVMSIEDITQQHVAEMSRNSFVAQATHELRTPLTNIRLYLETALENDQTDPALMGKALNVINQETRRLERMVSEMLSVAEMEAGQVKLKRDDVRLDKLFEELKADYEAQASDKQIFLSFNMPPKLPVMQGDRDKLALALHNVIANALKYTPTGGKVTVAVREEAKNLIVDVSDTGIGIEEQELSLIFDKFYRSKDPRVGKITGSGLGLALAREVVRLHEGDVTVQSQINNGSTFTVTLPTAREAA